MNWYGVAKTATARERSLQHDTDQVGWIDEFGDIQRYALDAYRCHVFMTKTNQKITVSVSVGHNMFGLVVFQDFWKFGLDEGDKAKKVFGEVKETVRKIFADFETDETPNNMLHTFVREAVRYIEPDHKPNTRVPFIDAARREKGEGDWRSTIYGTRYPEQTGF